MDNVTKGTKKELKRTYPYMKLVNTKAEDQRTYGFKRSKLEKTLNRNKYIKIEG